MQKKLLTSQRPRVGIGILVIQNGQILLGERINAHGFGTWAHPGGHLEYGETPFECAQRELKEEADLTATEITAGPWTNDLFEEDNKHYISLFMFVRHFEGKPKVMEPEKCSGWKWFDLDQLPNPLFKPLSNLLEEYTIFEEHKYHDTHRNK